MFGPWRKSSGSWVDSKKVRTQREDRVEYDPCMETPCEEAERLVGALESLIAEQKARIEELQRCDFFDALPAALIAFARMHQLLAGAYAHLVDVRTELGGNLPPLVSQEIISNGTTTRNFEGRTAMADFQGLGMT